LEEAAVSFGASTWLWGLLLVPFCALLFYRAERRAAVRLHEFVSPRLLSRLAGTVNRFARGLKYVLLLVALSFALIALAQPRWGYTYDEKKRKGLDLIFAVDTSRSMLSNDVQPNRLERVKLATQDLVNELQGDRVGLIAFAGRAFLQAPLTIDYGAAVDSINDLDTKTIPAGGTNISEAINLAIQTYGKSAVGNRALVIFTDGEELSGDAVKSAKAAADTGVRIFTVGVGTPEGSLIPISGEEGGTAFVKDSKGQVVKSKLDDKRLRELAEETGGFYLHLENGPRTMKQLIEQGLSKMQAGEIDARLSRRPIERYEWPLGAAVLALAASMLINDRKRRARSASSVAAVYDRRTSRQKVSDGHRPPLQTMVGAVIVSLFLVSNGYASAPGLDLYQQQKFKDAYTEFQKTLQEHPQTRATDKIQFDSGAAAYKMKDYKKALESFSQALLSKDSGLQSSSHYNLGNTLYQRGEGQKGDDKKLTDWTNALQHYEQTLKLQPQNKEAKDNYEFVKKKIDELKKKKEQQPTPTPTPTPSPSPSPQSGKGKDQQDQQNKGKDKQQQQKDQQGKSDKDKQEKDQSQSKSGNKDSGSDKQDQPKTEASPSPTPGESPSPSPGEGEQQEKDQSEQGASPSPGNNGNEQSPSPTPGEGDQSTEGESPTPTPTSSPQKKLAGEVKNAGEEKNEQKPSQTPEAEVAKEGEMTPEQAMRLLQSMKDEEQRVQLDERKAVRPVYNDW
jgi:Ca-activated chloride channel homolog